MRYQSNDHLEPGLRGFMAVEGIRVNLSPPRLSTTFSLYASATTEVAFSWVLLAAAHRPLRHIISQLAPKALTRYITRALLTRVLLKAFIYYVSTGSLFSFSSSTDKEQSSVRHTLKIPLSPPSHSKPLNFEGGKAHVKTHVMESDTSALPLFLLSAATIPSSIGKAKWNAENFSWAIVNLNIEQKQKKGKRGRLKCEGFAAMNWNGFRK